jgi:hypothetical protein
LIEARISNADKPEVKARYSSVLIPIICPNPNRICADCLADIREPQLELGDFYSARCEELAIKGCPTSGRT